MRYPHGLMDPAWYALIEQLRTLVLLRQVPTGPTVGPSSGEGPATRCNSRGLSPRFLGGEVQ